MNHIISVLLITALYALNTLAHPELFQIPWLLSSLDGSNQAAQAPQRAAAFASPIYQAAAPLQQQPQIVTSQLTYQASQQAPAAPPQRAFGAAQRSGTNPLSSFDTERLAPLQPSTLPPLLTFPTQFPPNYFHQEALQSNSVTLPPQTVTYAPPAQSSINVAQRAAAPAPSPIAAPGYDASVGNFWFKEGTPVLPCAYGINPLPQYNTPRKRCVPHSPLCGFAFTCIVDV